MKLLELRASQKAQITSVHGSGSFRSRLTEMGFVKGKQVTLLYTTPSGNPYVYELMGGQVALRKEEAENIDVEIATPGKEIEIHEDIDHQPQPSKQTFELPEADKSDLKETITIALVGNPNCGKTSLFNAASGGHERTGNYSGVTVSSVVGEMIFNGRHIKLVDLPGTYSIRAFSPEEAYVAHELASGKIDAVINVLDVNNLQRNLLLTLQLKERNIPIVGALNMFDEFEQSHSLINIDLLSERLGMPLQPTIARQHVGIDELLTQAISLADRHITLHKKGVQGHNHDADCIINNIEHDCPHCQGNHHKACPCPEREQEDIARYQRIDALLQGAYRKHSGRGEQITSAIDTLFARKWTAYPLFVALMWFIFWTTFTVGQYPMDWIDAGVGMLTDWCANVIPEGTLQALVCDGILGGVGSVIIFLPNILILYFLISLLEDSGYLARAAMLADPVLNRLGLHGKSFIPLLMGFGCNVPAVMAARTIENPKSRLLTMLVTPLMSCSARIPVYVVFAGAFFPQQASTVMLCLYLLGIIIALLVAWGMNKIMMRNMDSHFVMELPPYRMPELHGVCKHTWEKGRQYLHKMGGIILVASIVIWALGHFPQGNPELTESQQQEQSYMGRIGHAMEPVIKPLGYDWRMGVGILSGVGAKELMVSTLGVLYNIPEEELENEDSSQTHLQQILAQNTTPEAALSYMVFALLYFPCMATIAAIKGESGSWKWALFTAAYTTLLAYGMSFITYHLALLF